MLLLGIKALNGNYDTFHRLVKKLNVDTSHFTLKSNPNKIIIKRGIEEYLVKNCNYHINSSSLRKRLVKEGFLEYKCSCCGITEWLGKNIILQLDHIDGNHFNNELSNLRILCPNCHVQTETYCKNHGSRTYKKCPDCDIKISKKSERCIKCSGKTKSINHFLLRSNCPSKEDLMNDNITFKGNFRAIGEKYGVSDNSIKKWFKRYDIIKFKKLNIP